jgi:3-methyl-2-oxobutanoate hydroxymethyltransferase
MADICGEQDTSPRHARTYGDLAGLYRQVREERIRALTAFRLDVANGDFPGDGETAGLDAAELDEFMERLAQEAHNV